MTAVAVEELILKNTFDKLIDKEYALLMPHLNYIDNVDIVKKPRKNKYSNMRLEDIQDINELYYLIANEEYKKALNFYEGLDSLVREEIPNKIIDLLEKINEQ